VFTGSADRRLVLFYLANDILQNGRRRGADEFLEIFQDPLREAVTLIGYVTYVAKLKHRYLEIK